MELSKKAQDYLPIFLEMVSKNDMIFAHIDEGSEEDIVIDEIIGNLSESYNSLKHHKDTTVGLWATDKPDMFDDCEKIMFQITSV